MSGRIPIAVPLLLVLLALPAPAGPAGPGPVTVRQRHLMATYVTITVAAPESPRVLAAIEAGFGEVDRLEKLLSEWREDSQISRVNRQAGIAPVAVDPELFDLVQRALAVARQSGGAFDPTFQALHGLWDFKAARPKLPDPAELARRLALVDWHQVVLDPAAHTVFLKKRGMALGLGAIAKGYVIDRVSAVLGQRGFADHLVDAGGDLYASGTRGGRKWRIAVRNPRDRGLWASLEVSDQGVATSGNYERSFLLDGVRYHHLLDPRSGWPARGLSSVTVVAKDATAADAWATALFVMGPVRGMAAARRQGLEALFFSETFEPSGTPGLLDRLVPIAR